MRIRINVRALVTVTLAALVLASFGNLAGPVSALLAISLPSLALASVLHLGISWHNLAFHQDFSNDHPQKGERVHFVLHLTNQGPFPLAPGIAYLAQTGWQEGNGTQGSETIGLPIKSRKALEISRDIHCAWRGIYIAGLERIVLRDVLGLVTLEESLEPRIFYVLPELVSLDPRVEDLAQATGADREGRGGEERDLSIFEYLAPLQAGQTSRHIAWKYWARTGEPAVIEHGQSQSAGLSISLDLWPGLEGTEKLAAEDLAVSAAFSLLRHFARHAIPTRFDADGQHPVLIDSVEDFEELYEHSTGIIGKFGPIPEEAFAPGTARLFITTRPLSRLSAKQLARGRSAGTPVYDENTGDDLFEACRAAYRRGESPHILLCPPPSRVAEEFKALDLLEEMRQQSGSRTLLAIADSRLGVQELTHVLLN